MFEACRIKNTMPPSRSKAVEPRLALAQAINKVTAAQASFANAVEALSNFTRESLTEFDIKLDAKRKELEAMEQDLKMTIKNNKIEIDQTLREYKYVGATKILGEREEVPISEALLASYRSELESLRNGHKEETDAIVAKERKKAKGAQEAAVRYCKLQHSAESAELTATVKQQKIEIENLRNNIANLRKEIEAQRILTKEVANAANPRQTIISGGQESNRR